MHSSLLSLALGSCQLSEFEKIIIVTARSIEIVPRGGEHTSCPIAQTTTAPRTSRKEEEVPKMRSYGAAKSTPSVPRRSKPVVASMT